MRRLFTNSSKVQCLITDEGITFYGKEQEVYLPYGSIDSIHMSFMGILQATSHTKICCFAVDRQDRSEMKEMIRFAREAMKTAPAEDAQVIDLTKQDGTNAVSKDLPPEEQLRQYKQLFIQGVISKTEYDTHKRVLS